MHTEHKLPTDEASEKALPSSPFYNASLDLDECVIECDPKTIEVLAKGDAKKAQLLGEAKSAESGQRYVFLAFLDTSIKPPVFHIRAAPGFDYVGPEKEEKLRSVAEAYFGEGTDIIISDDPINTGNVHDFFLDNIKKRDPDFVAGKVILGFSLTKINGETDQDFILSWINRSIKNLKFFSINKLASGVFAVKQDIRSKPDIPAYDLGMDLERSMPMEFFEKLVKRITETLQAKSSQKFESRTQKCMNGDYPKKWHEMRILLRDDPQEAHKKIQSMLIQSLYIYVSDWTERQHEDYTLQKIIGSLEEAYRLGIPIDLNFIPEDFKQEKNILEKVKESKYKNVHDLYQKLLDLQKKFSSYNGLISAVISGYSTDVSVLLEKLNREDPEFQFRFFEELFKSTFEKYDYKFMDSLLDFIRKLPNEEIQLKLFTNIYSYFNKFINDLDPLKHSDWLLKLLQLKDKPPGLKINLGSIIYIRHQIEKFLEKIEDVSKRQEYIKAILNKESALGQILMSPHSSKIFSYGDEIFFENLQKLHRGEKLTKLLSSSPPIFDD